MADDAVVRATVIGATGRMGRELVRASRETSALRIVGAVAPSSSPHLGSDVGQPAGGNTLGVLITSDLRAAVASCDVVIDFSHPQSTAENLGACRAAKKPLLIGTTGYPPELTSAFAESARDIPLLVAANTSMGMSLLIELVRTCARALPLNFDIGIVEAHHRQKKDAPSGSALALGRAMAEARGRKLEEVAVMNRAAGVPPTQGDIGFSVIRGGDLVGEHTVLFTAPGEQLTLSHRATDRAVFARGALRAAAWLAVQPAGLYDMQDVAGYKTDT